MDRNSLSRANHFVPRGVLKRWSADGSYLYGYEILVPSETVPRWQRRAIRAVAWQEDLYTSWTGTKESDDLEIWFAQEIESPGLEAVDKLLTVGRLKRREWRDLTRLLALQDLRTPQSFLEMSQRWHTSMPDVLQRTMTAGLRQYEDARRTGQAPAATTAPNEFADTMRVRVEPGCGEGEAGKIVAEVTIGRRLWLTAIRHALSGVAEELLYHRWSVARFAPGHEVPITDHPVLRLNYYGENHYDFGGGWGRRSSNIIMPLSPQLVLYTQIGKKDDPAAFELSLDNTRLFQRLLAERAFRWVFATTPQNWVSAARPRIVDRSQWQRQREMWNRWNEDQLGAEISKTPAGDNP